MKAKTAQRPPFWTWLAPVAIAHLATRLSLLTEIVPGFFLFYFPVTVGLIMVMWWGPRAILGVYLNATFSAGLLTMGELPLYLYPVYGIPETIEVGLAWLLFTHWQKGKCWLPSLSEMLKMSFWGIVLPVTLSLTFMNLLYWGIGVKSSSELFAGMLNNWLPEVLVHLSLGVPVLVYGTASLEQKGWILTQGARIPDQIFAKPYAKWDWFERIFLAALVLVFSLISSFDQYWFVYGIVVLYASIRSGFQGANIATFFVFLFTYLLPSIFPGYYQTDWVSQESLLNLHLGVSLLTFSALIAGRIVSDSQQARLQLRDKNLDLKAANNAYDREIQLRQQIESKREELIRELENRNTEMESFTYTVSHDLKSPLITISGFLFLLKEDIQQGKMDRMETDLNRIENAVHLMGRLLDDLLELSRVGRIVNPPERVDLNLLLVEALDSLWEKQQQADIFIEVFPDFPPVRADKTRLRQVLQNLIENAIKFSINQPDPQVVIGHEKRDEEFVFFVRDNGIGIEPQHQERIFELFSRLDTNVEGTGIGLALAKRIIEVHNGRIWVESGGAGKGTTFYFTLPAF